MAEETRDERGGVTIREVDAPLPTERTLTTVGRFRVVALLGSGGMGSVYRAYDPTLERPVALKLLHPSSTGDETQQRRRALREARAAAALSHPNTVTIFEVGEADGTVFIAMELIEGETLRAVLQRRPPLEEMLGWLLDAARALAAAHQRGLVHRDVKPENMFVCEDGALKLLDFGIAKREEDALPGVEGSRPPSSIRTRDGRSPGTPRYMAPEQHLGIPTDARTDQYAWGLVAFEALTGLHATRDVATGEATEDADERTAAETRLAKLRAVPGLSDELAVVVARALEVMQGDRFPSMSPIVEALSTRRKAPAVSLAAPAKPRVRIAPAVVVALATALVLGTVATALVTKARVKKEVVASPRVASTCRVAASRSYPAGARDRIAILPGASLVVARRDANLAIPAAYESEAGGQLRAFAPFPAPVGDARLFGLPFAGAPALVAVSPQISLVSIWREGTGALLYERIPQPVAAGAATRFGDAIVIAFGGPNGEQAAGWAGIALVGLDDAIERGGTTTGSAVSSVAVAATDDHLAMTFATASATSFAFVDRHAAPGEVVKISDDVTPSALAFAGETPVVFWIAQTKEGPRLVSSALAPSGTSFAPRAVADDAPPLPTPPVTARLRSGAFVVAWLATVSGAPTVRLATVDPMGALSLPIDVARTHGERELALATSDLGLEVAWLDDETHTANVTRVACP